MTLDSALTVDRPREPRRSVLIRALVLDCRTGTSAEMRVRNLSEHGACLDHGGVLAAGDRLVVEIGLLNGLTATVKWVSATLAGICFDGPVELELARQSNKAPSTPKTGWLADLSSPY